MFEQGKVYVIGATDDEGITHLYNPGKGRGAGIEKFKGFLSYESAKRSLKSANRHRNEVLKYTGTYTDEYREELKNGYEIIELLVPHPYQLAD
ncbi:hypothetical protein [Fructilactobacillus frigidiflavus]|uniref:hypothetical protein n=1 Tax=Fructilactobacillus frigidiflavus TaxID=3242688 RepID=UPI00375746B9